ncbi:MAG: retropepsin-like aspartic protease family protein [Rhodoferax sp.]
MGIEDRDWYRDAHRQRELRQETAARQAPRSAWLTGFVPMLLFWCVVMGLLYAAMTYALQPKQARVQANGALVLPRAADGHFYVQGTVAGQPVRFLVDTGASLVVVSEPLAQAAGLAGGTPTTFATANGERAGRIVERVTVAAGPLALHNTRVGVGLSGMGPNEGLLGQSFLQHFDVSWSGQEMVLRPRQR